MLLLVGCYQRLVFGLQIDKDLSDKFILNAHSDRISCVSTSLDDRFFATGGDDDRVNVYDGKRNREMGTLTHSQSPIRSIAWLPSRSLVTGEENGTISLLLRTPSGWALPEEGVTALPHAHKGPISVIAAHPLGSLFLSCCSKDTRICLWNVATRTLAHQFLLPQVPVDCRWNDSGSSYAVLFSKSLQILSLDENTAPVTLSLPARANCFCWTSDGSVAIGGEDGNIYWGSSTPTDDIRAPVKAHNKRIKVLLYEGRRKVLISASSDGDVKVWSDELHLVASRQLGVRITCASLVNCA